MKRASEYDDLAEAIRDGLNYAVTRIFKYRDGPITELDLENEVATMVNHIMVSVSDVYTFDDENYSLKDLLIEVRDIMRNS